MNVQLPKLLDYFKIHIRFRTSSARELIFSELLTNQAKMKDLQCPRYKSAFKQATAVLVSKSVPSSHMRGPRMAAKWLPVRRHHSISVSYTLVLASAFGTSRDVASESTTDVEPEMAGAKVMPIFEKILPSLPVFFSCSKSGGGVCCSCCSRLYCSCNALCFFSSS